MHSSTSTLISEKESSGHEGLKPDLVSNGHSVWKTSILFTLVTAVLFGIVYPLVITGLATLIFPHKAGGSLILKDGQVIGSELLAQSFTSDRYFHPRPSAAGANGFDATSSSGSNLGPTSSNLVANIMANIATYRSDNNMATNAPVPADAVTESASGLDPHISVANAEIQIARVAKARGLTEAQVRGLIEQQTQGRDLGFLGEPRVNVLDLNLALDKVGK